jgi:hypothetical protein
LWLLFACQPEMRDAVALSSRTFDTRLQAQLCNLQATARRARFLPRNGKNQMV